jgi:chemotaxis family two-component system sensor kinase Cph1
MQLLIGGLLEYSRMGRQDLEPTEVSAEISLEQALSNLRAAIEEAAIEVRHDPMPTVMADPSQLSQVFQNLIGNAIKFRRRDVPATIQVTVDTAVSPYVFSVRDNGIGIAPEYAERVFVIFQRLHTRAEYPGTGIGLSICKKVLERHGGRIWVESKLAEGATFHFTLPAPRRLQ